jgi:UDP-GlcNAc:undecaprenyl-phosphate GlcNAc-1-phosphate transferase
VAIKVLQVLGFMIGGAGISIVCNILLLRFSRSLGIRNKNDVTVRWSSESKPSLGGVSLFVVFIFTAIGYSIVFDEINIFQNWKYVGLFLAGSLAFTMGLADDAYNTKPLIKLTVQMSCGLIFIATGSGIELFDNTIIDGALTVIWVVLVMNSLNMLDNMDGITGTTAFFILSSCLVSSWLIFDFNTNIWSLLIISMLGSLLGFLSMNIYPSRLFMGDAGSQFLGLFVAFFGMEFLFNAGVLLEQHSWVGICVAAVAFTPALVDTLTVVINRLKHRQSPMVGGKDHTTHHLVYAGLGDLKVWLVFVIIGLFATILTIAMVSLIKLNTIAPIAFFMFYIVFVFILLYRNTIKFPAPSKK